MRAEVEYIVDESIMGGFRMEVASRRIDASVEGQLRRIRKELVKQNRKLV
jgi:F0F1-type ATP synthase delta subunit